MDSSEADVPEGRKKKKKKSPSTKIHPFKKGV